MKVPSFTSNFRLRALTENQKYAIENTAVLTNTKYAAFEKKAAHKALAIVVHYIMSIYSAPLTHHCYASSFFSVETSDLLETTTGFCVF